jgi:hypothetical protein
LYCFLALEETVTAILYDAGHADVSVARGMMAGRKSAELRRLAERYRGPGGDTGIAAVVDTGLDAFDAARKEVRNQLLHAHPFTSEPDQEGQYVPGFGYTAADGSSWKTIARTPADLLDLATEIEQAIDPLNAARTAVRAMPPPS